MTTFQESCVPKHTPGPWTVNGREIDGPRDSGVIVARIPEWGIAADAPDAGPANVRLIAASPCLLAALQQALLLIDTYRDALAGDGALTAAIARSAIAKARGES